MSGWEIFGPYLRRPVWPDNVAIALKSGLAILPELPDNWT